MEENQNVSKKGWKRIFGKKWFFPAVYLTMAALLLTAVLWYQNLDNQIPEATEEPQSELENDESFGNPSEFDKDSDPVVSQQEIVKMPVAEENQTEIVTKFYDYDAGSEDQEKALVLYDNKYYQSDGVDFASANGESFDVTASLSGTVTEVKEDPLLGNLIKIDHGNDISTYYASLENVLVESGAEVKQGDAIATAGRNLFGQASGTHVHFELRKNGEPVNPEDYFNQSMADIEVEELEQEEKTDEETMQEDPEQGTSSDREDDSTEDEDEADEGAEEENVNENTESSAAMANA
ncbi:M23 family metallopeptidase [Aquibacillus rhizosphaerae]|uniref:M23 family metallopeptidase n=1 Tax=Aquibacillus rhizosphaerae TaxID=3051431 RepID=A0ABT7KZC4_9BACI|nr:M23 family metallopeptidase [Aquibacillus sp. LR5S19]MDL4838869.1 M23 family metallopeptidase [Aquibacillus sp. LR5S19]